MWAKVIMETERETSNGKDWTWTARLHDRTRKGKARLASQKRYMSTFGLHLLHTLRWARRRRHEVPGRAAWAWGPG